MAEDADKETAPPPPENTTTPPHEDPHVEIHKPKPVHSWRELLTEIGVIVIGVAIALAAEQAVEWLHWQSEVSLARQSLHAEMTIADTYFASRIANTPCVEQKLDRVGAMIEAVAAGRQPPAVVTHFNGLGELISDSDWQAERSSQILTHFPRVELARMSRYYAELTTMVGWGLEEANAWAGLAVLQDASQKLGPGDLAQLRLNYHLARRFAYAIAINARRQLAESDALGIKYSAPAPAQNDSCRETSVQTRF